MNFRTLLFVSAMALSLLPFAAFFLKSHENNNVAKPVVKVETTKNESTESPVNKVDKALSEVQISMTDEISVQNSQQEGVKEPKVAEIVYPETNNSKSPLGINTNEVYEQDASVPFVDLFRVATPFHENIRCRKKDKPCLTSPEVTYDEQGWPKNLNGGKAGVFFIRNVNRDAFPPGNYTVLYDGEGNIEYLNNAKLKQRAEGEDIIELDARSDGFMTAALQITESNPDNPLRNIRILMPGGICFNKPFEHAKDESECTNDKDGKAGFLSYKEHHDKILFNPDYLNFMKDFGVIRFMPMSGVTRNPAVTWDQRPKMDEATWGGLYGARGVPLEIQIELANRLKSNPWLNVPHAADDDYFYRFAIYVNENLDESLTPYIEYTNEAWNANFIHNEYVQKMGIAQKLDQDAQMAGYKFYAKRSLELFEVFNIVYGGHERFIRVISGWDTRPDISGIILAYENTYKNTDVLAIAPYVGGNVRGFRESKDVDEIFHLLTDKQSYRSLPKVIEEIKKHADLAKEFGVELISYEGGQGLVDWATRDYMQHPNPLFFSANRDERMGDLYQNLYKQWRDMGAGLFVAFASPRSCNADGCWGLKEHIRQDPDKAPKLAASLDFIEKNIAWWSVDSIKTKKKAESNKVAHYLPELNPKKPRIVLRPAKGDDKKIKRLENPNALNILLEGETWDKRDISGKWQVKWDKQNLYFLAKVYDKESKSDSEDPRNDDSVELYIDGNNSRGRYDKKRDYHLVFSRDKRNVYTSTNNPETFKIDVDYEVEEKYDGYEITALIPWKELGIKPDVKKRLGIDVVINDDDTGGVRQARLAWNSRQTDPLPDDFGMVLMSGR